jgi:hydroxyethylthiazole kinase
MTTAVIDMATQAAGALERLRRRQPRVHCLMNTVVQKFVADGLTVLGAIPSMTSSVEEVEHFVAGADALLVNLGTLDPARRIAIDIGVETANAHGIRWSLDPVHCDASPPRFAFAKQLIAGGPSVVRGNALEMQRLKVGHGVAAVVTGAEDRIVYRGKTIAVGNGHPWLALTTGTGCMTGALISAFLAVEDDPAVAAVSALVAMGVAAELAAEASRGPGTFTPALLDALHALDSVTLLERARISDGQG